MKNEWDNASGEWIESLEINKIRTNVIIPMTLELLGDVNGMRVLDLGCGEGEYSRLFYKNGAEVIGVDYSEALIKAANKKNENNEIIYYAMDACNLQGLENDYFDRVVSPMCLMAIEDVQLAIKEAYRVLKDNGELLVSILHPCFSKENYFEEGPFQESLSKQLNKLITFYHKTLSQTINLYLEVGFNLKQLYEPQISTKSDAVPKILFLKFTK